jgi:ParB family chromosome partitioning protein
MPTSNESSTGKGLRKRLGRGLGSLISAPVHVDLQANRQPEPINPSVSIEHEPSKPAHDDSGLMAIPLSSIHPNPRQPRQDFDPDALRTLADSISRSGMMQPIVVRPAIQSGSSSKSSQSIPASYQIIAGERRWRACQLLGLQSIQAVVRDVDDRTAAQFSLIENLQREDLNPIERAEAFQRLIEQFGLTHQEIAESVGLDRSSITNHLRLNELDDATKDLVRAGRLSLGHAKVLLAVANISLRAGLATQVVQQEWSVRELERRVKSSHQAQPMSELAVAAPATPALAHMNDLQKRLGEHLGTKVHIRTGRSKGSGKLIIEFYNLDQFEGLMQRLAFNGE